LSVTEQRTLNQLSSIANYGKEYFEDDLFVFRSEIKNTG